MNATLTRALVLVAVVVLASGIGLAVRWRSGRARAVTGGNVLTPAELGVPLGVRATFVQFSSPVCSSCRSVRRVLTELVALDPELGYADLDATVRLDLADRLGIMRTPTVLLLDPAGRVVSRSSGPLTPAQARAAVPAPLSEQIDQIDQIRSR